MCNTYLYIILLGKDEEMISYSIDRKMGIRTWIITHSMSMHLCKGGRQGIIVSNVKNITSTNIVYNITL
jgi:hypothetical protein